MCELDRESIFWRSKQIKSVINSKHKNDFSIKLATSIDDIVMYWDCVTGLKASLKRNSALKGEDVQERIIKREKKEN